LPLPALAVTKVMLVFMLRPPILSARHSR